MTKHSLSEAFELMAKMSDDTIDKTITPRLAALALEEHPDPYELDKIIDECVYGSLCTDAMIIAMRALSDLLKKERYP